MNARFEEWGEDRLVEIAKTCREFPALEGMRRIVLPRGHSTPELPSTMI